MYINKDNLKHDLIVAWIVLLSIFALAIIVYGLFWLVQHETIGMIVVIALFSIAIIMIVYSRYFHKSEKQ